MPRKLAKNKKQSFSLIRTFWPCFKFNRTDNAKRIFVCFTIGILPGRLLLLSFAERLTELTQIDRMLSIQCHLFQD